MERLQEFMLNGKVLNGQVLSNGKESAKIINKNKKEESNKVEASISDVLFYPEQTDQLFWCFYIIKNGFSSYEYPGNTSFTNEKSEKFKCIELLREKKNILKDKKIKNVKEDVEDELANKERIGMKTFIALCAVNNINILYIHNRKCFSNINTNDPTIHVVHSLPYNKYCYESKVSAEKIDDYKINYFNWENIDKPLRSMSYYTLDDLMTLCKKSLLIGVADEKKKTKKDLYEMLVTYLS